ncbi:MAG TPA: STAS domain-containing protein [Actinophytocola sp.]|jgi:anti-anti-sigma factor|uniref:STAS domain-containing protein n=1 Tax=Actinophytocola sp. TaxID=1872138 RepID=UPI002F9327EB
MTGLDQSPDPDVELDVRVRRDERAVVLEIDGEVDLVTSGRFHTALEQAGSARPDVLVLDLRGVAFLGSIGLSHLLEVHALVGAGVLRVVPSPAARRTIEVACLHPVLTMYDTVEDALGVTR